MLTGPTARQAFIMWVEHRMRGGFTEGEAFTVSEAAAALPGYSRSQVWRVVQSLATAGELLGAPVDGRTVKYRPSAKWRKRAAKA